MVRNVPPPITLSDFGNDKNGYSFKNFLFEEIDKTNYENYLSTGGTMDVYEYYIRYDIPISAVCWIQPCDRLIINLKMIEEDTSTIANIKTITSPESFLWTKKIYHQFRLPDVKNDSTVETPYCHFDINNKSFLGPTHYQ